MQPEIEPAEASEAGPVYAGALALYSKGLIGPAPRRAVRRDEPEARNELEPGPDKRSSAGWAGCGAVP